MRWWQWIWAPVIILFGIMAALYLRRNPLKQIRREFKAVDAATEARKTTIKHGAYRARQEVEEKHADIMEKLEEHQQIQAYALGSNPVALAKYLNRIAKD